MVRATEYAEARLHATFRVGVTGHRYVASAGAAAGLLRDQTRAVFAYLWQTVVDSAPTGSQPALVVVSPLAEGADRLIAHEAVANGFPLYCPLPFDRDAYEQDFTDPASREEYRHLLARAVMVEELPGSHATHATTEAAYAAVGRIVVEQSDLLIAIWDGEAERGRGGTASVVQEARACQLPVVWIAAQPPHAIRVLTNGVDAAWSDHGRDALAARIHERVRRSSRDG
ncbi:MAG: hypothetical protein M3Y58_08325 [Chloroflexota bacterium]|nr:hypothetical protein [Chloroflexota bacterium]